jgi:hypothetical protein
MVMALTMTSGPLWHGPIILRTLPLWVGAMNPAMAGTVHGTRYEEKTLNRLHTICDDGARAVSRYNRILECCETTITVSPRNACTGRMNPRTKQVEVRCC